MIFIGTEAVHSYIYWHISCIVDPDRVDRRAKELTMLLEEEKSTSQRLQDQLNSTNTKMRTLRRDKEDAEGEVETMKTKVRQMRSALDEAEENSSNLEAQLTRMRAAARKKVYMHIVGVFACI